MGRLALPERARPQRYVRKEGNIAYNSANSGNQAVGQTAYLTSIDLISLETVTTTTTGPTGGFGTLSQGAFQALGNCQVRLNGGRAPFSMPGYHTDIFTRVWDQDYASDLTTNPQVTNSVNAYVNHLRMPLVVDPVSERGAFYSGDTALNINVTLTFNAVSTLFQTTNGATIAGSWDVYSEKFEAPQPDLSVDDSTGNWLDKISFYVQSELYGSFTLPNGTTNINLETDQDFLRIILVFYTGSLNAFSYLPADALYTSITLKVNDVANIWDTVAEARMRFEMDLQYTNKLPAGTCVLDFLRRYGSPTRRDILPTDPNIAKRLTLQIVSTSSNNQVDVITQSSTDDPFSAKWVQLAASRAKRGR